MSTVTISVKSDMQNIVKELKPGALNSEKKFDLNFWKFVLLSSTSLLIKPLVSCREIRSL